MNQIQKLLVPKSKTWRESLEYYYDFFKIDLSKYLNISNEDYAYFNLDENDPFILENTDGYNLQNRYEHGKPISLEILEEINKKGQLDLPKELKELYTECGSLSINEEEGFMIFNPESDKEYSYFIDELSNYNFKDIFIDEMHILSDKEYKDLIERFFFWGIGFRDSDKGNALLYFYDRTIQKYGEVVMLTDNAPKMESDFLPHLINGSFSKDTLDEVISRQINRILLQILLNDDLEFLSLNDLNNTEKLLIESLDLI